MKLHLSSIRLFFVLIVLIVGISIYGSTIPPEEITPQNDVFHAWYFTLILILLSLNVAACTINRLKAGYKLRPSVVLHLGIIIILAGAAVGALWGQKGELKISEGETKYSFASRRGEVVPLGFGIALDDFILEKYNNSKTDTLLAKVEGESASLPEGEEGEYSFSVETGKRHDLGKSGYSLEVIEYIPDFVMDTKENQVYTRSNEPNNPALKVKIDGPNGTEERWAFAKFPDFGTVKDTNIRLLYSWNPSPVKEFKSKLRILEDNKTVVEKTIEVNDPLRYKGYAFYQSSYDSQEMRWSGLQVVNDPGVSVVYAGFAILIIGTSWALGKKIIK